MLRTQGIRVPSFYFWAACLLEKAWKTSLFAGLLILLETDSQICFYQGSHEGVWVSDSLTPLDQMNGLIFTDFHFDIPIFASFPPSLPF